MLAKRDMAAAGVAVGCLDGLAPSGRALVVDDATGTLAAKLSGLGCDVSLWNRCAAGDVRASAWPESGPFDLATIRLPRSREWFGMILHAVGSRLTANGRVLVYGPNDEGIKSADRPMKPFFEPVETLDTRRHCRALLATQAEQPPQYRGELSDWRSEVAAKLPDGRTMRWVSYPGVFAHGRLDEGTRLLLGALPDLEPRSRVLDFGCGAGVLSMGLERFHRSRSALGFC